MTVALIDADIIIYESAYRCQTKVDWGDGEGETATANFPDAQEDFRATVAFIARRTGSDEGLLALTDSDRDANFRRAVWPTYKAHRETKGDGRPLLYSALREWVRQEFVVKEIKGIEGDDTIGILATGDVNGLPKDTRERIMCSVDKDLLTIPGRHFNWRKEEEGIIEVTPEQAWYNLMTQTLVGDSTDNYPGCPGIGAVKAFRYLETLSELPEWAQWEEVEALFVERGLTEADALIQARCARILQAEDWNFETKQVRLWTPPEAS
jgi:5'-3' exonuclease